MAKYDAFGREIGEDTLAGLGGGSVLEPTAEADAATVEVGAPPPPPPQPQITTPPPDDPTIRRPHELWPRRRPRPRRGLWLLAAVLLLIGFGIQAAVESGIDGIGDSEVVSPLKPVIVGDGEQPGSGEPRSLLTPRRFGLAMDKLQESGRGRLFNVRLAADRVDAQVVTGDGRIRITQISPSLDVRTLATVGGGSAIPTYAFEDVRAQAPQRLIRAAARRLDQPRSAVNYLVLVRFGTDLQWAVYFKNSRYALADERGRIKRVY